MKVCIIIIMCIIFYALSSQAQKRGAVWCFGDSALVNFGDTSNIITGNSTVKSRGSCVSIADSSGQLLMYAFTRAGVNGNSTLIKKSQDSLIQDGDTIVGEGWYSELVMLPYPESDSLYVLFSIGVTGSSEEGLYYTMVDINANGGSGQVIQKNVQLENFKAVDCLTAIKHGNGRDWWIIFRKAEYPSGSNNDYYMYLVSQSGIESQPIQSIGSQNSTNAGKISYSPIGDKMCFINYKGLIELFTFDRCTGFLSNPETISPENLISPWPALWSSEFSPSGECLYVSRISEHIADSSRLYQYDLTAANISNSKVIIWETAFVTTITQLKRAPDNKIYIATNFGQVYPYTDSMYNAINMNLSVINSPDSLGLACNLQPFSFSLGGKRCYAGLPNNPDYDLEALAGSPCDSLTSLSEVIIISDAELFVYYNTNWQTAFINGNKLKGTKYQLEVFDLIGKSIFRESGNITPPYYTKNLNCAGFAKGMYVVNLVTDKERLVKRFVVR